MNENYSYEGFVDIKRLIVSVILLLFLILTLYGGSLRSPFIFDDIRKIKENPDIKKITNLPASLVYPFDKDVKVYRRNEPSRPLVYLTYTLNYHFGKLDPAGYRLFNMIMHFLTSVLVFILAVQIFSYFLHRKEVWLLSFFSAVLFAVHPLNTDAVTYIFGRSSILVTFFYLLSLLFFIRTFTQHRKNHIASVVFCLLAFCSKETAVTLPLVFLIADYFLISRNNVKRVLNRTMIHMPYWIILGIYLVYKHFYIGGIFEKGTARGVSGILYLAAQPFALLKYIRLLLFPAGYSLDHVIKLPDTVFGLSVMIPFAMILISAASVYLVCRRKTKTSEIVLFGILWFLITILPTANFIFINQVIAERRMYLSGIGIYIIVITVIYRLAGQIGERMKIGKSHIAVLFFVLYTVFFGAVTYGRNRLYKDPVLIWQDVTSRYANSIRAHNNLGNLYLERAEYEKASEEFKKALDIDPRDAIIRNNLGLLYSKTGRPEDAMNEYTKAAMYDPHFAEPYYNMGNLYSVRKSYEMSLKSYEKAVMINPRYADAYYNLGNLLKDQKDYGRAAQEYRRTVMLDPEYAKAYINLGNLYAMRGDYQKAFKEYNNALAAAPETKGVHFNLGKLYLKVKNYQLAREEMEKALLIDPDNQLIVDKINAIRNIKPE
ncbi:MAG: tetratricopeptide repeat protein [Elusimicrobiota bacterium]